MLLFKTSPGQLTPVSDWFGLVGRSVGGFGGCSWVVSDLFELALGLFALGVLLVFLFWQWL